MYMHDIELFKIYFNNKK